jgi:regulator of sigma E protease
MLGGVFVNVVLAIVIFIGLSFYWGEDNLPAKNVIYGVHPSELASNMGIKEGDIIVSLDQKELDNFDALEGKLILTNPKTLQVKRGDSIVSLTIPANLSSAIAKFKKTSPFVTPRIPVVIDSVGKSAVILNGAINKDDTLLKMNNESIQYQFEFLEVKKRFADSIVLITAKRGNDTVLIKTLISGSGQLGLFVKLPYALFKTAHKNYSFLEAIPEGAHRCYITLDNYITGIKQIFTGKVNPNDSLGSLISIGNTFPSSWDWEKFWTLTAIFSIILAFMNVLPIPALDGGHALFILVEMITGRKPSDKFMEYAQIVGMLIMFGLMFYALGLDFWRLFK